MKKLLLLVYLLSAVVFYGYSQSLVLSNTSGPLAANAILTQTGNHDSLELITYLYVKNISAQSINVLCKKVEVSAMDSVETTMCWAGGCYPSFVNVSPNAQPILAGQTISDFSGHYGSTTGRGFKPGESVERWVFYNESNPGDSVCITVKYATWSVGVDEKNSRQGMLSNAYPNPANAKFTCNYSVPSGSTGTIIIRNLVGAAVQSEELPSGSGAVTIHTSGLSDGIYFYSLMLDGKVSQTKKLVVRH